MTYFVCLSGSSLETGPLLELLFAPGEPGRRIFVDLSKMKKLKAVAFRCETLRVRWIVVALETITSNHRDFQGISIYIPRFLVATGDPESIRRAVGEEIYGEWADLDHLLVRFLESCAVHTRIVYDEAAGGCKCMGGLLPEMMARGIIEVGTSR